MAQIMRLKNFFLGYKIKNRLFSVFLYMEWEAEDGKRVGGTGVRERVIDLLGIKRLACKLLVLVKVRPISENIPSVHLVYSEKQPLWLFEGQLCELKK